MSKGKTVAELVARTAARRKAGLIPDYSRKRAARTVAQPCVHGPGEPTGITRPCQGCGGKRVEVPLLACAVYGECTVGKSVTLEDGSPVRPCSNLCPSYTPRDIPH